MPVDVAGYRLKEIAENPETLLRCW